MANVSFYICSTVSDVNGYNSKSEGDLFFASSEGKIYRYNGSSLETYGGACKIRVKTDTGDYTAASDKSTDVLYVNTYDKTLKIWSGSAYITLAQEVTTSVRASGSATNTVIPTEAAVRSAIDSAISSAISDVTVDVSSGTSSSNSGKAPQLDSSGMLPSYVIPAYAISEFIGTFSSLNDATTDSGISSAEKGDYIIIKHSTDTTDTYNTDESEDGTWILSGSTASSTSSWTQISTPDTDTQYSNATTATPGLVQPDGTTITVSSGVISAVKSWRPFKVGNTTVNDNTTTVEFAGGSNVTVSYNSGTVTIAATDTTYSVAEASVSGSGGSNGLMSAADKEKLDGLSVLEWQTISNS